MHYHLFLPIVIDFRLAEVEAKDESGRQTYQTRFLPDTITASE